MKHNITVGQTLYYAPERGEPRTVKVTKVGRRWAYLDGTTRRVALDTMVVHDGGFAWGTCFLSEDDYQSMTETRKAWRSLRDRVSRFAIPEGVTLNDINAAAKLLKLDLS